MLEVGDEKAAAALNADLAGLEQGDEIRAVVGLRAFRHQALGPHVANSCEHLFDAGAGRAAPRRRLRGRIFAPEATIIGDVVKMLQPGQAAEK